MPQRLTAIRLFAPIATVSVLLLMLCGISAGYLYHLQLSVATELKENVSSRRAAYNLEDGLSELILNHSNEFAAPSYRTKIQELIADVLRYADKPRERELAVKAEHGFATYLRLIDNLPVPSDANREVAEQATLDVLNRQVVQTSQSLRAFNAEQIELSERAIRRSLAYAAWGLGLVGVVGSAAGLMMGYGVARLLRQTIHRLQVQVRDAADKLGQDLPAVVIQGGDLSQLDEQVGGVVRQVEQVVQKLQQREREVLRAEQLAAVGQLAAGVAHEIRNPLTSIKLLVEMAREDAEARATPIDDLRVIEDEIRRMERSLNAFLAFARPPRPEKSPQELSHLVEQTLSLVQGRANRQNVTLQFCKLDRAVIVEADGGQLQQVFVNLALNSLEAMPGGGHIVVEMKPPADGTVELELKDTGPGIAPEMRPRLFEPFASDKETGLGLGLVISKRIVEDHGGSLTAGTTNGGGASFIVRLPAKAG